jgi:hypothetical protein
VDSSRSPPPLFAWLFGALGCVVVAAALLAPGMADPIQRGAGVALGALVLCAAGLLALHPTRFAQPARYAFFAAVVVTGFALLGWCVALFATGPFAVTAGGGGASVAFGTGGLAPRLAFGFAGLVCSLVAALCWRSWWRVRRGAPPQFR